MGDITRRQEEASELSAQIPISIDFRFREERTLEMLSLAVTPLTTEASNETARDETLARVEIGVQAFVFAMAIIGNSGVLLALRYRKRKTSRMHLFILHLSFADLLVAFFNVLPQMAWDVTFRFLGTDSVCRFVKYMQVMVLYLSTYILVMTAVDRYRAICRPLSNYSWTPRKVHMMVGLAWLLAALLSLPQVFIFRRREVTQGKYDCWAQFRPEWTLQVYITIFSLTIYVLPFACLVILYGRICYVVWKNVRRGKGSQTNGLHHCGKITYKFNGTGHISVIPEQSSQNGRILGVGRRHQERGFSQSKLKTIKLTFVVILAYLVCWSPFMITQMWWAYDETAPYENSTFVICLLLANLNSCCNPWIYMAFSGNLLQHLVPCCRAHAPHEARHKCGSPARPRPEVDLRRMCQRPEQGLPESLPLTALACKQRSQPALNASRTSTTKLTWGVRRESPPYPAGGGRRLGPGFAEQELLPSARCECRRCSLHLPMTQSLSHGASVSRLAQTD